jgi:hypothetical protein
MGRDDVTREIVNSVRCHPTTASLAHCPEALHAFLLLCPQWKSDYTIASVVLSERLGRLAAELAGWMGTRVGQDDIWWKPPGTKAVSFHQVGPGLVGSVAFVQAEC